MAESLDIARAWVDACDRRDVDAALALCDPAIELIEAETLPGAVTATGVEEVRRYLERFDVHWSEGNWTPRLQLVGRRSGIKVDREWSYVFTVGNGKLLRQVGFDQPGEALRSAGIA